MYVIVPRSVPALPVFIRSVMPQPDMTSERRSAILSAYFRPWTLVFKYGSSRGHVPLARNLSLPPKRQRSGRTAPSFRKALKNYLRGHIVSNSNRILWANVLRTMTTMPENADEGEDDQDSKPVEALPENAFPVLSPSSIMAELRRVDRDAGADAAGEDIGNLSHSVHKALEQSMSFWDPPNSDPALHVPQRQSALRHSSAMPAGARGNAQEPPRKTAGPKKREKLYPGDADLSRDIQSWRSGRGRGEIWRRGVAESMICTQFCRGRPIRFALEAVVEDEVVGVRAGVSRTYFVRSMYSVTSCRDW